MSVVREVKFFWEPDLTVKAEGPVGAEETKKDITNIDERVVGEVFDQLMYLKHYWMIRAPFVILSSYKHWRVCWLNDSESNKLAAEECSIVRSDDVGMATPSKQTQQDKSPPTSPEHHNEAVDLGNRPENGSFDSDSREVCASELCSIDQAANCYRLIVSAIAKMAKARPTKLIHPFANLFSRQLVLYTEVTHVWAPIPPRKFQRPNWLQMPNALAKELYAVKSFSSSERSRVVLGTTASGAVCVIKFLCDHKLGENDTQRSERHRQELSKEMECWKNIYRQFSRDIRVLTLDNKPALLLPHFDHPSNRNDGAVLKAIAKTLTDDYQQKGWYHDDVAWRNIGIRRRDGIVVAVVYDMESVKKVAEMSKSPEANWIHTALRKLTDRA